MFIASVDEVHEADVERPQSLRRNSSMRVPSPRHATPHMLAISSNGQFGGRSISRNETDLRSMKNELAVVTAELRDASVDLEMKQQKLRY